MDAPLQQSEKSDFLARIRLREMVLMGLIAATALLANLPERYTAMLGIDTGMLIAVLAIAVILGLFLYLKFLLFVAVVLLIAGANMPDQIAAGLGISKAPILLALLALVGIGLVNHVVRLLPTGLEPRPRQRSQEAVRAMFYGIERHNLGYVQKVLAMNYDANLHHDNGYTPLAYAAMKGSVPMLELLLRNGASPALATREGDAPVELALRFGHDEAADVLRRAGETAARAEQPSMPPAPGSAYTV
jgi:uncharacterized protein